MQREGGCSLVRQSHLIAVVRAFLMGCAVLLMVGCSGGRSEAPQEEKQGHSKQAASKEDRCKGTRTFTLKEYHSFQGWIWRGTYTTNDVPGCPKGGLITGTDKRDELAGNDGDDEIRGLGDRDELLGGSGSDVLYGGRDADLLYGGEGDDVLYGGDGDDNKRVLAGGTGEDVIYGGDGDDFLNASGDRQRDELYCGEGRDEYLASKGDYVSSSCEKKVKVIVVS